MGFLGTLGKIGVGLGSMIPGVGPLISMAGNALMNKRGGAPKPGFDPNTTAQAGTEGQRGMTDRVAGGLADLSRTSAGTSQDFASGALQDLGTSRDYYGKLMSGDAAVRMEHLSPEINASRMNTKAAQAAIQRSGARGGGTAQAGREATIGGANEITRIMAGARPAGALGLLETIKAGTQGGVGFGQLAADSGRGAGALVQQQVNADLQKQQGLNNVALGQMRQGGIEKAANDEAMAGVGEAFAKGGGWAGAKEGAGNFLSGVPGLIKIPGMGKVI